MTFSKADPSSASSNYDIVCFSHLRWDFVYQRPQHLLSRFVAQRRVFYIEEPIFGVSHPHLTHSLRDSGVVVVVAHLPHSCDANIILRSLIDDFFAQQQIRSFALWFYTPMPLPWAQHLKPQAVVYDCMDELSNFKGAPPEIKNREQDLLQWADAVFTGGNSLYEAKREQHANIYSFPSSVDAQHFARARAIANEPLDQSSIPGLRLGFFGVIDERMDLDLIAAVAAMCPSWHMVLIGPVVKIDPASLPQLPNVHYLGMKRYDELPSYIAGWDVAMLPFGRNDATRFISPTKTLEYLAAGLPVVSTSIQDVLCPYAETGVVHIGDTPEAFVAAVERSLSEAPGPRLKRVDALLSQTSWSRTWGRMAEILDDVVERRKISVPAGHQRKPLAAAAAVGAQL